MTLLRERQVKGGKRPPERRRGEYFWRLLFPPRCLTCQKLLKIAAAVPLCEDCRAQFSFAGLFCPRCGQHLPPRISCSCAPEAAPLQGLFALSWYEGVWRQVLHRFKFRGERALARPLGRWLGTLIEEETAWGPELVVPVPLHRRREKERGYNQAHLLARFTAEALGLPLRPLLVRPGEAPPQSSLSYRHRLTNVRGAFLYRGGLQRGNRVLLVDDIYSTGATMQEAAAVLHRRGLLVFGAVAAYTPRFP
ncbi:MAG: ComF family protein [Firmicutes bacterium]|nr:ComF family protein [Bacillota bacterium]